MNQFQSLPKAIRQNPLDVVVRTAFALLYAFVLSIPALAQTTALPSTPSAAGLAPDNSYGASDGTAEWYRADGFFSGTSTPPGTDTVQSCNTQNGSIYYSGSTGTCAFVRSTKFSPKHLFCSIRLYYNASSSTNDACYFTQAPAKTVAGGSQDFGLVTNAGAIVYYNLGNGTTVIPANTLGSGITDLEFEAYGDGTCSISAVAWASLKRLYTSRFACTVPSGLQNIQLQTTGANSSSGITQVRAGYDYAQATAIYLNGNADGGGPNSITLTPIDWTTNGSNTWMYYFASPNHSARGANSTIIVSHGCCTSALSSINGYNYDGNSVPYTDTAMAKGYDLLIMDNSTVPVGNSTTTNLYGGPQSNTDVSNLWSWARTGFGAAEMPYMSMDSMGGISGLQAIMKGLIQPRAVHMASPNTNLLWYCQYGDNVPTLQSLYGFTGACGGSSGSTSYNTKTAGYDPQLILTMSDPVLNQTTAGTATESHMRALLLAVPYLIYASPYCGANSGSGCDAEVDTSQNGQLFCSEINAAGGSCTFVQTAAPHDDPANFPGAAILNFFQSH